MRRRGPLLLLLPLLGGCLYTSVRAPYAYRSATPADVAASASDPTVAGEACSTSLLYLVAWGDQGYAAAARAALAERPEDILYDVRSDTRLRSYLFGLYARGCTVVTGRAGKPKA